jgi:hypothetical protein
MAGAGNKLFTSGSVLTASDVNTYLMDQTIMRFTSTTTRDAAFGGAGEPTLAEGMFAYTTDTNTLWLYNGSSWVNLLGSDIGEQALSNRNVVINGAMTIDQRNSGAAINPVFQQLTVDRWTHFASQTGKLSFQQNQGGVTPPVGFSYYSGLTSLSAFSIAATDQFLQFQKIEGYNIAKLNWGTANAKTATLSFWVRSSLTGTFGGSIQNSAQNRCFPYSYTISSANTWEYKTVVIAGDTTGTWLTTNGVGAQINFSLATGSTYSGTAGAWTGTSFISSVTGAVSVVGTNAATWQVTGVQLEAGSVATPFEFEDYSTTLAKCQRYYFRLQPNAASRMLSTTGFNSFTTRGLVVVPFPVTLRTRPTAIEQSGTATDYKIAHGITATTLSAVPAFSAETTDSLALFACDVSAGLTVGDGSILLTNNSSAYLAWSAEL